MSQQTSLPSAGRARTWADVMHAEEGSISVDPDCPRRMTPDPTEVARALELHRQGMSLRKIAEVMGLSHMTIRRYLALATDAGDESL